MSYIEGLLGCKKVFFLSCQGSAHTFKACLMCLVTHMPPYIYAYSQFREHTPKQKCLHCVHAIIFSKPKPKNAVVNSQAKNLLSYKCKITVTQWIMPSMKQDIGPLSLILTIPCEVDLITPILCVEKLRPHRLEWDSSKSTLCFPEITRVFSLCFSCQKKTAWKRRPACVCRVGWHVFASFRAYTPL